MANIRKTNKYYREQMAKGVNSTILAEVIVKYGYTRYGKSYIGSNAEMGWNFKVEGFIVDSRGILFVDIYWQGDDTDGNEFIKFDELWGKVARGGEYVIRAESYYDGYRTRYRHGDIRISHDDIVSAYNDIIAYIDPVKVKERKKAKEEKERLETLSKTLAPKAKALIEGNREFVVHGWHNKGGYEYACGIVNRVINENLDAFGKMTDEEFKDAVYRLFNRNKYGSYRQAMYGECEPCLSWS